MKLLVLVLMVLLDLSLAHKAWVVTCPEEGQKIDHIDIDKLTEIQLKTVFDGFHITRTDTSGRVDIYRLKFYCIIAENHYRLEQLYFEVKGIYGKYYNMILKPTLFNIHI